MSLVVRPATPSETSDLAELAARTFALACPPGSLPSDISAHLATHLSARNFADHITDPQRRVAVAEQAGRLVGYTMLVFAPPPEDVARQLSTTPTAELSKIYVDPDHHGGAVARALMEHAVTCARSTGQAAVWLGTNEANQRAQRFYAKHGFVRVGTKRFRLGSQWEDDFIYELVL